ncbi:MAG: peptidylprolyl isomerase [Gammaproteobacteria bacterium]|nr:peptidylprolyl isomerase [Gammaproteobacteria bacterium]
MKISRFIALASLAALAACQQAGKDAAKTADKADPAAEVVATVDGVALTRNTFDFYIKAATGKASADLAPEQRQEVLDSLIRMQLVAAQAQKDGLDKEKDISAALDLSRLDVLQRALQQKYLKDKAPTEQELRAEYETQLAQMPRTEYRARHILVQTEEFANRLMERLKKGEKFERVARESLDSSKENGGDLGWFNPQSMVKPFADAVMTLKKGETTAKPVQTQYGWHIIRLEDTREVQPPPFDAVKGQLGQVVLAKKFKGYSDELLKTAKVEKKL